MNALSQFLRPALSDLMARFTGVSFGARIKFWKCDTACRQWVRLRTAERAVPKISFLVCCGRMPLALPLDHRRRGQRKSVYFKKRERCSSGPYLSDNAPSRINGPALKSCCHAAVLFFCTSIQTLEKIFIFVVLGRRHLFSHSRRMQCYRFGLRRPDVRCWHRT